ncbi:phenylalanine--tRNA ligase subunit beta [Candidatus Kaiserbacteria bacterium]|nr:MAG: phenylalanine--tRNA ligase subunit beta [Candidatus Kaiserbacteria bacterium]
MKVSYEWLETFFDAGTLPRVAELEQLLTFHAFEIENVEEVAGTSVIDVDVLPNRAADSLSHRGVAREISALLNISMQHDPLKEEVNLTPETDSIAIELDTDASCTYYNAARITGVAVGESPQWLQKRLEAIGQKSINNVVDATNYVLFNIGQPTHVFDATKFSGTTPSIGTRHAERGEKISLLGGTEVELDETMTVIIDRASDTPLAVAGVKGGVHAEVVNETTDIIIESATFDPVQTRKTSQALKIRTDASARFENNVADELAAYGVKAVTTLILELAGGQIQGYASAGATKPTNKEVGVTASRASKLLGADITDEIMEDIFKRLAFSYTKDGDVFNVTAPFERRDIHIPEDIIEEIGRVYGYNKIESQQLPPAQKTPRINKKFAYAELIRKTLIESGVTETFLYSLRDTGEVKLVNSLASDKDHLRSNLKDGLRELLDTSEKNMPLLGLYETVSLFEIGNVFTNGAEEMHVCVAVRVTGKKKKDERTLSALVAIKERLEEVLGTTLPEPVDETLEWNLDTVLETAPELDAYPNVPTVADAVSYKPFSQYPFMLRDIAVWVPESTTEESVREVIETHASDLLQRCDMFDVFTKDGRTSYAFHLVFQSMDETLTDEKVGVIMSGIEDEMSAQNGWEIR